MYVSLKPWSGCQRKEISRSKSQLFVPTHSEVAIHYDTTVLAQYFQNQGIEKFPIHGLKILL